MSSSNRGGPEFGVGQGHVDHGAVDGPVGQQHAQGGGRRLGGDEPHVGVLRRQPVQQEGDEPSGGGTDHPQADAAPDLLVQRGQVGRDGVHLGLYGPGAGLDGLALLGELARLAVDELDAELTFQAHDVARDIGLDGVQGAGRPRKAPVVGDSHQGG